MIIEDFFNEKTLTHYFQPICDLNTGKSIGYEALIRSTLHSSPEYLFDKVKQDGKLYELDSLSIYKAISTYPIDKHNQSKETLFVNILPSTIIDPKFPSFIAETARIIRPNQQVVFGISESEIASNFELLKNRIFLIKSYGIQVAIDDIGKGYVSGQSLIELEPEYLKLDLYFSKDLHISKKKQLFVSMCVNYSKQSGANLILEGIETAEELFVAKSLGINIGQGYYLGKPSLLVTSI